MFQKGVIFHLVDNEPFMKNIFFKELIKKQFKKLLLTK